MNQVVTTTPKPALVAGGEIAAIVPRTLEETFRLAGAISASGMAPQSLKTPEQVMVAIMAGAELGFPPFQALQSFAVINGKPNIWGDAIPALLWSQGFELDEWFDDDDEPTKAFCKVTRPSGKVIERTFSIADAKKANLVGKTGPWQTNQKRMLQMRARAFAARDGASDVLKGFQVREEVEDYQPIRGEAPAKSGVMARLTGQGAGPGFTETAVAEALGEELPKTVEEIDKVLDGDIIPDFDPQTGEVVEPAAEAAEFTDAASAQETGPGVDAAAETFPGDEPATRSTTASGGEAPNKASPSGGVTLQTKVDDFHRRIGAATATVKLSSLWAASAALRDELAALDDPRLTEMEERFAARFATVEAAEKAATR